MKRCSHTQLEIHEETKDSITHILADGQKIDEVFDDGQGEPTGFIEVSCLLCGGSWRFNRFVSVRGLCRVPMWVREVVNIAGVPFKITRGI